MSCLQNTVPYPASAAGAWLPGPRDPSLSTRAFHVWKVDLARTELPLEVLDTEEDKRRARFTLERDGLIWARSRALLRTLLGRYLETDPVGVRILTGPRGKPFVDPRGQGRRLHFNLSHSDELALYAFAAHGAVGVDVEVMREPGRRASTDPVALAARVFGAEAAARLAALPPQSHERELLRLWTRHEAELKCRGTGIGAAAAADQADGEAPVKPWIAELDVGAGAVAALAAERGPALELRRWEWAS